MNTLYFGLVRYLTELSVTQTFFHGLENKFSTTSRALVNDGTTIGLLTRLRNVLKRSRDDFCSNNSWTPKYMSLSIRSITDHGSGNKKPPFSEPIVTTQHGKTKSLDQKKTINYLNTFPTYEDAGYRSGWMGKLTDETVIPQETEELPKYILKQKWGVNLLEPMALEQKRGARQSVVSKLTDVIQSKKKKSDSLKKDEVVTETETSSAAIDSTVNVSGVSSASENRKVDLSKPLQEQELKNKQIMKDSSVNKSGIVLNTEDNVGKNDEYNDPQDIYQTDELSAWQNVITKTKEHIKQLEEEAMKIKNQPEQDEKPEIKFSILPEPPRPKLDMPTVKTKNLDYRDYIDAVYDASEGPTAMGVRIALHEINNEKSVTRLPQKNQTFQALNKK